MREAGGAGLQGITHAVREAACGAVGDPSGKTGKAAWGSSRPKPTLSSQPGSTTPIKAATPRRVEREQRTSRERSASTTAPSPPPSREESERPIEACSPAGIGPLLPRSIKHAREGGGPKRRGGPRSSRGRRREPLPPRRWGHGRSARGRPAAAPPPRGGAEDARAGAGACPPATRRGVCRMGEGRRSVGEGASCLGGGLAAGGCAGGDAVGRGLDVRAGVGVGPPWGVSAGEGHVWIGEGDGHVWEGGGCAGGGGGGGCQPRPPRGPDT